MKDLSHLLFGPLLAGASLRDRLIACLGAFIGIALAAITCVEMSPLASVTLIAPIGASAVLLFAVPSSPLAQPWSIIGGNIVSMTVGIAIAHLDAGPLVEAGLAVSGAILAMSVLRCLHPPGGAVALSVILGSSDMLTAADHIVVAAPVVVNSLALVLIGWFFHRYSGHSYPHRAVPVMWKELPPAPAAGVLLDDIDKALEELGETFDVSREDLAVLLARAEVHADRRRSRLAATEMAGPAVVGAPDWRKRA